MDEDLIDLVADYKEGKLAPAQRAKFEAKCAGNSEFQAEAEKVATALTAVRAARKARIRALLTTEIADRERRAERRRKIYRAGKIMLPAAAVVLIVIGLTGGFRKKMSTEYLYNEYFGLPVGQDFFVNAGQQLWNEALTFYNAAEYDSVAVSLETMVAQGDSTGEVKLYLAVTYLEKGSYDKAIDNLRDIGPQSAYFEAEAMWYTALTYLRMGNIEQANAMLDDCLAIDNFYKKEAAEDLKKDIRRIKK